MTLSIVSVVLFRIININEVIRGMFRMFQQIVSGKLGQSFLEAGLHSATAFSQCLEYDYSFCFHDQI